MRSEAVFVVLCHLAALVAPDQMLIDSIARYLKIRYDVINNFANSWITFDGKLTLENTGPEIPAGNDTIWSLYFCHIRLFEPNRIRPDGADLGSTGLRVFHENGCLHKIEPTAAFGGIPPGKTVEVLFRASDWLVARTDVMPNWYVMAPGAQARTVDGTAGTQLDWVGSFVAEEQYKRQPDDKYSPYTAAERLQIWRQQDACRTKQVIPTPFEQDLNSSLTVNILRADWLVVAASVQLLGEARYLADKLDTVVVNATERPHNRYIQLDFDLSLTSSGSYTLMSDTEGEKITIDGKDKAGVFYGIQTLLSLASTNGEVPHGHVTDQPRFQYRGMFVDVARNFRPKEDIFRLLDVMAMYKLNKLHLHLSDDEGWRLEIPDLPELTEVGARRCHDESGMECIMPQLGSPPGIGSDSGTGFYSVQDYSQIVQYAADRHIEVIPEFDMPGHAHAAINAMLARYQRYIAYDPAAAKEYLLSDLADTSDYLSVQYYTDNAINPCINSTYRFIELVVAAVKDVHAAVQPLKTFHFGGDEVPSGAWLNSPACEKMDTPPDHWKGHFVRMVAGIVGAAGLDLAGWEDGFVEKKGGGVVPIERNALPVGAAYGYVWNNVWEWGNGELAYVMANANYTVILSHATHLYFDHPYEPDPEDRGYYWATRFTPVSKVFSYLPDSIYENIDVDRMGNELTKEEICSKFNCTELSPGKESNILGMQGQVWGETVRTSENFDYMTYPRLLALAERAWHKASWEGIDDATEREIQMAADWDDFACTLGSKELARLDRMGVMYGIQPPGASMDETTGELEALAEFPGLPVWYSFDEGGTWSEYKTGVVVEADDVCTNPVIYFTTRSADSQRRSRTVILKVSDICISSGAVPKVSLLASCAPLVVVIYVRRRIVNP